MKKNYKIMRNSTTLLIFIVLLFVFGGCKKFLQVNSPITSITSESVFINDNTAISVLTHIYAVIGTRVNQPISPDAGFNSISLVTDLSADNLTLFNLDNEKMRNYYENNLQSINTAAGTILWERGYEYIYRVNAAIEGLNASTTLTPRIKQQLIGEAKFFRAFYYFYLVNLYGDIPLTTTSDYVFNSALPRSPVNTVYQQIITDLNEARGLLDERYLAVDMKTPTVERIRVNKAAATAMLARAYLFTGDYANAELMATEVINNPLYEIIKDDLGKVFLKNSRETIWSLQPTYANQNTWQPRFFLLPSTGPNATFPVYLSDDLISKFSATDRRLSSWIGTATVGATRYNYPAKYKAGPAVTALTEYEMVLRLAEQYFIRAEARAQQDKLTGTNSALSDLNVIRERAGLLASSETAKPRILDLIGEERRRELFTEWGDRWLDLKRTAKINTVMGAYTTIKGGVWQPFKALYPIAQSQLDLSPAIRDQQNPGYN